MLDNLVRGLNRPLSAVTTPFSIVGEHKNVEPFVLNVFPKLVIIEHP